MVLVAVQLSVPGLYLPPVFSGISFACATPHDHFAAGPHCRMKPSTISYVSETGGGPSVSAGIISATGVRIVTGSIEIKPAPNNHLAAGPHCGVFESVMGARS